MLATAATAVQALAPITLVAALMVGLVAQAAAALMAAAM